MTTATSNLHHALNYIQKGRAVFPIWWVIFDQASTARCACGDTKCTKNAGKHPIGNLVPSGFKGATTDQRLIRDWWTQYPRANIGTPIMPSELVLDIDPRNGGDNSLTRLQIDYDDLPLTPTNKTGGGGLHIFFTIPTQVRFKATGNLSSVGYPGIDTKALGGYVVLPPSNHASGRTYQPEPGRALGEMPATGLPNWLANLIHQAQSNHQPLIQVPTENATQGPARKTPQKTTYPQILASFAQQYSEGERHEALVKLTGFLRNRGVPLARTISFFLWWQKVHFIPLEDTDTLNYQLTQMYRTYGSPSKDKYEEGSNFLQLLSKDLTEGVNPLMGIGYIDPQKKPSMPRRELGQARMGELYAFRKLLTRQLLQEQDREFYTSYNNPIGNGGKLAILLENPNLALSKEALLELLSAAEGPLGKGYKRLESCGWSLVGTCVEHGERMRTHASCKLACHSTCPTETAVKLRQLILEDKTDGSAYLEVWLESSFELLGEDSTDWKGCIENEMAAFEHTLRRIGNSQVYQGKVLFRAVAFFLGRTTRVHWKVMFLEGHEGEMQEAIDKLCGSLSAHVTATRRIFTGESAIVQLIEDSMTSLIGMESPDPELFAAYYYATKGRHIFQGYSSLYKLLRQVKREETPRCEICSKKLLFYSLSPQMEEERRQIKERVGPPRGVSSDLTLQPSFI